MKLAFTMAAAGGALTGLTSLMHMPVIVPGVALMAGCAGMGLGLAARLCLAGLANDDNPFAFFGGMFGGIACLLGGGGLVIHSANSFQAPMEEKLLSVVEERYGPDMRNLRPGQEVDFNLSLPGGVLIPFRAQTEGDVAINLVSGDKGDPIRVRICADFNVTIRDTQDAAPMDVTTCKVRELRFDETVRVVRALQP